MPSYKAWPFQEAQQIVQRRTIEPSQTVLFETGFGPSGLPHIGTFAEVARTTWVQRAYQHLTGTPTRLQAFSDDMDGLRKVPQNLPQSDMLTAHLGRPLHTIPDPFGCCASFSDHMNNKLREFLDAYGFDYQFQSSKEAYQRGDFDRGLTILLEKVEEVRALIVPTLGEERRATWSPFFPICPSCGSVYATRVTGYHPQRQSLDFICDGEVGSVQGCGHQGEISVLGGHVKVNWKVDWALRWYTYDVDYEMYGKDLIESARLSSKIVRLMGKQPPVGLTYELFLDENGHKISKSVGAGLTVDTWVQYAPLDSLLYYIYQNPKKARRLYWDVVPKCVDDYLEALRRYPSIAPEKQAEQDVWHIIGADRPVPTFDAKVNFSTVNNLIAALGADSEDLLLDYLERYDPQIRTFPEIAQALVQKGLTYYRDQILPNKRLRPPTQDERAWLTQIREQLDKAGADEDEVQGIPFAVARAAGIEPRALFSAIYQVLLGQDRGPRFGSFVQLVGKERVLALLDEHAA
ncbi:MAG: lysine--tRNA ligase [Candidatus Latescibacteria bacterium]|nr:lysine--tRNA ligase [Candidatus Latescibacterota bacterium]